jgi:hypothetical protein
MIKPRISRTVKRAIRPLSEGMSTRHLELIRACHCVVSWATPPCDAHHLLRVEGEGVKGMARRHADRWAVPLAHRLHTADFGVDTAHGSGDDEAWLASKGIDGRALANALWTTTGDLAAMERVVFMFHQRGRLIVAQLNSVMW